MQDPVEQQLDGDLIYAGAGFFTIDPARRRQAYEAVNRQHPHGYMVKLLQGLVALGMTRVEATVGEALQLTVYGASLPDGLLGKLDEFLTRGGPLDSQPAAALLQHGCLLLACRPDLELSLESAHDCLVVSSSGCRRVAAGEPGSASLRLTVQSVAERPKVFQASVWTVDLLNWQMGVRWPEWVKALEQWKFAPVSLWVNGQPFRPTGFGRGFRGEMHLVAQGGVVDSGRPHYLRVAAAPARTDVCSLFWDADRSTPLTPGPGEEVDLCRAWRLRMRDESSPRGILHACAYGFSLVEYAVYPYGLQLALDLSDHRTDASGLNFVADLDFNGAIDAFECEVEEQLRELSRWAATLGWRYWNRASAVRRVLQNFRR